MADDRVLITTFGFDESKVLRAMRRLPYDRLVVILGEDAMSTPGYDRLVALERLAGNEVTARAVNVFDFSECLREVTEVIGEYNRPPWRVVLNVSGGTKILADAAILAAFHAGVEAYHCEDELVKLPVLQGLGLTDRFSECQRAVLQAIVPGDTVPEVLGKARGRGGPAVRRAVNSLVRMGVLHPWLEGGELRLRIAEGHESMLEGLRGSHQS